MAERLNGGDRVTKPDRAAHGTYELVSLIPADGWRAVFWVFGDGDGPPWDAKSMIAWGVYDVMENPGLGNMTPAVKVGREIHGLVCDADGIWAVPECSGFWRYLPPGERVSQAEAAEARAVLANRREAAPGSRRGNTSAASARRAAVG